MLAEVKVAMRKRAFVQRKAAFAAGAPEACAALADELAQFKGAVLAGYMPMRTEIDPLAAMAQHSGPVCVPVITGAGQPLVFHRWTPQSVMVPGEFGALIPQVSEPLTPDVLIVPLLAFDRRGYRLGYGGGFYDRTLEALRARGRAVAIGFAFAAQEMDAVPTEPTDQPLDLLVTETEVLRFP